MKQKTGSICLSVLESLNLKVELPIIAKSEHVGAIFVWNKPFEQKNRAPFLYKSSFCI
jgi:hypothetical protein